MGDGVFFWVGAENLVKEFIFPVILSSYLIRMTMTKCIHGEYFSIQISFFFFYSLKTIYFLSHYSLNMFNQEFESK